MRELRIGSGQLELRQGDITTFRADAIVNAANSSLAGGGGVDGAIHRVGGPEIVADLERRYGRERHCPTGSAVITTGGRLPARWVIHAVGPIWRGGHSGESELLRAAYDAALRLAVEVGARSVTLPSISTGIYGYPLDRAALIAIAVARAYLTTGSFERIVFVLFSPDSLREFEGALAASAGA